MARSPLVQRLGFALHAFRRSRATGIPLAEVADLRSGLLLDRRRFLGACLGASAAAVGLSGLVGCGESRESKKASIAIIGAGIAGLHCAYRLRKAGVRATVYEASSRIGGRMLSDRVTFPGQHCELGGELIDGGHQTMHRLAKELDIALLDYQDDHQKLDELVGYIAGRKLAREEMVREFAPIAAMIDQALTALTDPDGGVTYDQPNGGAALDRLSLADWLDSVGAKGAMRTLLEVAYTIEFGLEPSHNNVLNMLLMISTEAEQLALFGESDERFHAAGGNDLFVTKLAGKLDSDQVRFGAVLERVRLLPDGRYQLAFKQGSGASEAVADHVVLALPFSILRSIPIEAELPAVKRRAIAEIGYGANTKLMVGFASRLWRDQGSDGQVFTDLPFQNTWDTSRLQPGSAGIITNFTGGQHARDIAVGDPQAHARDFVEQFDRVIPGAKAAATGKSVRMAWPEQPWVRGSYSSYLVGQYTAFAGSEPERVGNLHFCGEHTCLDAQGYMEGGALSGELAAAEVGADLGVEIKTAQRSPHARRLARRQTTLTAAMV